MKTFYWMLTAFMLVFIFMVGTGAIGVSASDSNNQLETQMSAEPSQETLRSYAPDYFYRMMKNRTPQRTPNTTWGPAPSGVGLGYDEAVMLHD